MGRSILRVPGSHAIYRAGLYYSADTVLSPIVRSRVLGHPAKWIAKRHLRSQVPDEGLLEALTPSYRIGSKRILFDSHFYPALNKQNVHLITDPIERISPTSIETKSGETKPVDIIICATGFEASEFLVPISVRDRSGRNLNGDWKAGAEAFMGVTVHGYLNAFMIAGPNTFKPAGSNPGMKEVQIAYIMKYVRWKMETGAARVEVSQEATVEYQKWLNKKMGRTIWPTAGDSWYRHESGKITNPWPASARTFARMLDCHPR